MVRQEIRGKDFYIFTDSKTELWQYCRYHDLPHDKIINGCGGYYLENHKLSSHTKPKNVVLEYSHRTGMFLLTWTASHRLIKRYLIGLLYRTSPDEKWSLIKTYEARKALQKKWIQLPTPDYTEQGGEFLVIIKSSCRDYTESDPVESNIITIHKGEHGNGSF